MKTITGAFKKLLICILLFLSGYFYSQTCPISVTVNPLAAGVTDLYATAPGSNAAMYTWNFGNGTPTVGGINLYTTTATYTANGAYTVSVTYVDQVNSCTSFTTTFINITSACGLTVNTTLANSQNLCNGSATVSNFGFCGPVSYTWFPGGAASPVNTNMCLGTYTVLGSSSGSCCPSASLIFTMTVPPCNISGSTNIVNNGGGNLSFSSTATGTVAATTYTWDFGDGSPPVYTPLANHTYSANGNYTASVNVRNNYLCSSLSIIPLSITNSTYCNTNASFIYTVGANGNVAFLSNSTGTTTNSAYFWLFGDGTSTTGISANHPYTSNGVYSATLIVYKNYPANPCVDSVAITVTVTTICALNTSFTFTNLSATTISLTSTSAGTIGSSTYLWNFGDGSTTSTLTNVVHTYTANGNYSVSLMVVNNPNCIDTQISLIQITGVPCQLVANYSHVVGNSGQVNFTSGSTGTTNTTSYFWDFGDGIYSLVANPSHTYLYNGAYAVMLKVTNGNCRDSIITSINVTGLPCAANAVFNLSPGQQPQYWIATPAYPWNITGATWDWGDGSISAGLYTSHIYSVAGTYSICLTVTTSCGATDSYCNPSTVYKTSEPQALIYVNVMKPGLVNSLADVAPAGMECSLFPNPAPGEFQLSLKGLSASPVLISVYNLTGELIYQESPETKEHELNKQILLDAENGIYILMIGQDDKRMTKKLVISKN